MENTLYPKDVILVNKLSYGPKLPLSYTEIPWINLLTKGTIQEEPWSYRRWSGVNTIQSGDVLVFESIKTPFAVKRCIGTPGDELKIVKGEIFLNEKKFKSPNHVKQMYDIEVSDKPSFYSALDSLNVESNLFPIKGSLMISGSLSYKDYLLVSKINVVKKITQKVEKKNKAQLFPTTSFDRWTLDEMTVFTIPKKEWTIELNEVNFHLYQKTIQRYENISIVRLEEGFFANGKQISTYTFTKDYLFVMGDHRKNSVDSRHFGFVPIEAVVGKVQCVLYSNYKDKFQWDRLLKNVQESQ
jgi:signal peptidase I